MAEDPILPPASPSAPEWLPPATLSYSGPYQGGYGGQLPPVAPPALFELRPLSLSEILDRTFALYRSRFWLFAGIAVFSGAFQAAVGALQMLTQGHVLRQFPAIGGSGTRPILLPTSGGLLSTLIAIFGSLLFFLAYSVTTAATVWAVSEVYLNRVATVKESFRATIQRWYRYVGIALWQGCSFAWPMLVALVPAGLLFATRNTAAIVVASLLMFVGVIGGLVVGYILYLRNMLAVPACVTEGLAIRPSMRRSKVLAVGSKGRIFVLQLIIFALYMVVGMLQAPFSMLSIFSPAMTHGAVPYILQSVAIVIGFLGHTVVTPVLAVGLTLLYFDNRVRKEAFDIAVLMGEEQAGAFAAVHAPAVPVYAAPAYPVATPYASPDPASFTGVAEPIIPTSQPARDADTQAGHEPLV